VLGLLVNTVVSQVNSIQQMCVEGAVMAELAQELLGVKECDFRPCHVNNLANEFRCYANYKTTLTHDSA